MTTNPKIGLALGSGSARGLSHIGVIYELEKLGIKPDIVTGCSMGAFIGASYVQGNLDKFYDWALDIRELDMAKFFNLNLVTAGFVSRDKLEEIYAEIIGELDANMEKAAMPFATVATDLSTGKEVWIKTGKIIDSVLASAAYPGLFAPVKVNKRWMIDGGLTNPVPISLCYDMGADIVIAVSLTSDRIQKFPINDTDEPTGDTFWDRTLLNIKNSLSLTSEHPRAWDTISNALNILQIQVARNKLATNPADILLMPRLPDINLLDMYKAKSAIQAGRECVQRMAKEIVYQIENYQH